MNIDESSIIPDPIEIALMERTGKFKSLGSLANEIGLSIHELALIRSTPEYQHILISGEAPVPALITPGDMGRAFDAQVESSLKELVRLRDNAEKDETRLKAALAILDHAPSMPSKGAAQAPVVHIHIPVDQKRAITDALEDIGEGELIKLLEDGTND